MQSGREQFRAWIGRMGLKQREVAEMFGWFESTISQYLSGERVPQTANAVKIEERTGIPVRAWLLTPDDKAESEPVAVAGKRKIHRA